MTASVFSIHSHFVLPIESSLPFCNVKIMRGNTMGKIRDKHPTNVRTEKKHIVMHLKWMCGTEKAYFHRWNYSYFSKIHRNVVNIRVHLQKERVNNKIIVVHVQHGNRGLKIAAIHAVPKQNGKRVHGICWLIRNDLISILYQSQCEQGQMYRYNHNTAKSCRIYVPSMISKLIWSSRLLIILLTHYAQHTFCACDSVTRENRSGLGGKSGVWYPALILISWK